MNKIVASASLIRPSYAQAKINAIGNPIIRRTKTIFVTQSGASKVSAARATICANNHDAMV